MRPGSEPLHPRFVAHGGAVAYAAGPSQRSQEAMGSNRFRMDMPRSVDFYRDGRLELDEMISARIGLPDVNDALDELRAGEAARQVIVFDA